MKKLTLLFSLFFALTTTHAQNYLISFAATGAVTTLDSIKVENLTHLASLTISGGDVLHLISSSGINDITTNEEMIKISPNPMQGQAEILFYAKEAGNTQVLVYDISGRKLLQTDGNLSQGIQEYHLSGLKQGQYFLKIIGENYLYTSKLISQNTNQGEAKIEYVGSKKQETVISILKSTKATVNMSYTTGDNLLFTGYSGTYNAIALDVPTTSKTITFTFSSFTCGTSTVTDIDGNTYNTVLIGAQCWMKENLKTTRYSNGTTMYDGTSAGDITGNYTIEYYFDYNNTPSNTVIYGKLYTWAAVWSANTCPTGWHVPSDGEWNKMEKYLDITTDTTTTGWVGTDIGNKLKESGTSHWSSGNNGTNSSDFTALPGGYRSTDGSFWYIGEAGYWWTAPAGNDTYAWFRDLYHSYATVDRWSFCGSGRGDGHSVRCLKDN